MKASFKPSLRTGVEVHAVEDGCVVYVPSADQVHFLNATAMCVLELCDGTRDVAGIQHELEELAGGELGFDVGASILPQFEQAGIVAGTAREPS